MRPGECLSLAETLDAARTALIDPRCVKPFLARCRLEEIDLDFAASAPYPVRPNKLAGLPAEWVDALAEDLPDVTFLIESDGARHRLLKAPADHEPVVPTATTLLVPTADLAVVRKPLTDEFLKNVWGNYPQKDFRYANLIYPAPDSLKGNLINQMVLNGWVKMADSAKTDISPCNDNRPFIAQMGLWNNLDFGKMEKIGLS